MVNWFAKRIRKTARIEDSSIQLIAIVALWCCWWASSGIARAQVVSYGMRKLALSTNQFGIDLLRTLDRNSGERDLLEANSSSFTFCPFCVATSLAILLAGLSPYHSISSSSSNRSRGDMRYHFGDDSKSITTTTATTAYDALRHALYLGSMQPQEIHLAFLDLASHLQLNLPDGFRAKRDTRKPSFDSSTPLDRSQNVNIFDQVHKEDDGGDEHDHDDGDGSMPESRQNVFPVISAIPAAAESSTHRQQMITQLYVQRYLPIDYEYYVALQHFYKTPIRPLDFAYASEESLAHINAIVERQTNGAIKDIVPFSSSANLAEINWSQTKILLLSGLYFRGRLDFRDPVANHNRRRAISGRARWRNSKKPTAALANLAQKPLVAVPMIPPAISSFTPPPTPSPTTQPTSPPIPAKNFNPFAALNPTDGVTREQSLKSKESIRLRYAFSSYLNATIVEMPFTGGMLSLVTLVPSTSGERATETMLSRLNAQLLVDLVQNLEIRKIDITMPMLNLSYSITNWNKLFAQMGLSNIFDLDEQQQQQQQQAEFGGTFATTFAGMRKFPLSSACNLQHKSVLDISIEDDDPDRSISGQKMTRISPNKKLRPKRNASRLAFSRIARQASANKQQQVVQSSVMRVIERDDAHRHHLRPSSEIFSGPQQPQPQHSPPAAQLSKQVTHNKIIKPAKVVAKQQTKQIHVSLEETFVYFILDNISGLIIAMGKHNSSSR